MINNFFSFKLSESLIITVQELREINHGLVNASEIHVEISFLSMRNRNGKKIMDYWLKSLTFKITVEQSRDYKFKHYQKKNLAKD